MLDQIVTVNITRETRVPSRLGFGVPAILSKEADAILDSRVTTFDASTMLSALVAEGFTTASETYKCAQAIINQNPRVQTIKVIKQADSVAQEDTINIDTIENETSYVVTVNGVEYEFVSDVDATDAEIQAGLIALLDAIDDFSAEANGTDKIDTSSDVAGKGYSLSVSANMSVTSVTENLGPVEEIISARDVDDDWYFLYDTTHSKVQALLVAGYIESQIKLYGVQTDDADSKDLAEANDTDGLLKQLKDKNYDRTHSVWTFTDKLGEYKTAAWGGVQAPKDPGASTWKFKTANGISSDKFSAQERSNIQDKNGNVYVKIASIDMFQEGVAASGEFIDIMRGTDWIQARIQEAVFGLLTTEDKVAYSDGGIETVGLQVEEVLDRAVDRTILLGGEQGPVVTVPRRSETAVADRAERTLRDVTFTGFYAGAIHKVQIDGRLSV